MKLFLFLATLVISTAYSQAGELTYESNRCEHMAGLSFKDKAFDKVFRKFSKIQAECCDNSVADACDSIAGYISCKALASAGFKNAECPSTCKQWAEDCGGYITLSNREVKNKIENKHGAGSMLDE